MDERILDSIARLFKLLGDANRLRILFVIGKEERSVSEIISETSLPQTLVSFHLRPLRESGILTTERKGPFIYYRISEPGLIDLLASLSGISPKEGRKGKVNFILPPMQFMQRWME